MVSVDVKPSVSFPSRSTHLCPHLRPFPVSFQPDVLAYQGLPCTQKNTFRFTQAPSYSRLALFLWQLANTAGWDGFRELPAFARFALPSAAF